ncbi:hypothetical protein [Halalkalibacter alkalisediminis]|uniref:Flagellar protein FliT n=1 Tax=Halalkalibacter alkalisediminis TaxID=935616 RepID=A0ABV6NEW6_9BACI|nr:hypothetical protein [Halalkalibacter alkalisediminis]
MNQTIHRLVQVSDELLQLLKTLTLADNEQRDEEISKVEKLLEERGAAIAAIDSPAKTAEELAAAKTLVQMNKEIVVNLQRLKAKLKIDMDKMALKKKMNRKYDHPYDMTTNEGAFIDKRDV